MRKSKTLEFTVYYNRFKKRIFNYVLRMTGDKMLCEDIVQSVFLSLYENMEAIKNKERIKYWLFTAARNKVYEHFRRKHVHADKFNAYDVDEIEFDAGIDILRNFELKELREMIMSELEEMPEEQKDVYLLKEYGELTYKEIAKLLGIDEKLVKSRLFKVRQKLINSISKKI